MNFFIKVAAPEAHGKLFTDVVDAVRFWSKVRVGAPGECWPWAGSLTKLGYGQFRHGPRLVMAHRLAYLDSVGPLDEGQVVRHGCDFRGCCNPAHLESGTQKENVADAIRRGRFKLPKRPVFQTTV